jgi:hypothetical protein
LSAPLPPARRFVTGLFADPQQASRAFERLVEASFDPYEISVLRVDGRVFERIAVDHRTGIPVGVTTGAALGGTVGLVAALALGGPAGLGFAAAGPVLATLQGAVAGAAGGGLLGALAGLAFWWDEPDLEGDLQHGTVVLGVTAHGARARVARHALQAAGASRIFG